VNAVDAGESRRLLLWETGSVDALLKSVPASYGSDAKFPSIVRALAEAYPKDFVGIEIRASGEAMILLANDCALPYDDGQTKTFEQRIEKPDVEDMFSDLYPLANPTDRLPENFDPGRYRIDQMFMAVYGRSAEEVAKNCAKVDFCGQPVTFNRRAGASDALGKVSAELSSLVQAQPELAAYVEKLGGGFNWRQIAGTQQLSNHSFGIAIDLNPSQGAYWRWQPLPRLPAYSRLGFPQSVIEIFERHGFIWGGKWYHYDTMHFEYRPELIGYARRKTGN
jgi:hypothetical protein